LGLAFLVLGAMVLVSGTGRVPDLVGGTAWIVFGVAHLVVARVRRRRWVRQEQERVGLQRP
jgi:uncharacterized protein (TIGR03382 family)